jgi:hypothetical protein
LLTTYTLAAKLPGTLTGGKYMGKKKLIAGILSLLILFNFSFTGVRAAENTLNARIDSETKTVTVTGDCSAPEGQRIMILASDSQKNIKYLDQGKVGAGGSISFSFPIPDAANDETYVVRVWGEGLSELTASFTCKGNNPSDSVITPAAADFDRYNAEDIQVSITWNQNTLKAVKNGQTELQKGIDYTISGNVVTVKKEYILSLTGAKGELTFVFSAGENQKLIINLSDSKPTPTPTSTPTPTPWPTSAPQPTSTPRPTTTPQPTATPRPTSVPTPTPDIPNEGAAVTTSKTTDSKGNTIIEGVISKTSDELQGGLIDFSGIKIDKTVMNSSKKKSTDIKVAVKDAEGKVLYSWIFTGKSLKSSAAKPADINAGLVMVPAKTEDNLKSIIIASEKVSDGIVLKFQQKGDLPANAEVKLYVGQSIGKADGTVYLYSFNEKTKKLEELPVTKYTADKNGYITMNLVHGDSYVLLGDKPSSKVIVPILEQVKVKVSNSTLSQGKKAAIKVTLPVTLEKVNSFKTDKVSSKGVKPVAITYQTSNSKIAAVSKNGAITGKKAGKATITVTAKLSDGTQKTFKTKVTVK